MIVVVAAIIVFDCCGGFRGRVQGGEVLLVLFKSKLDKCKISLRCMHDAAWCCVMLRDAAGVLRGAV